MGREKIILGLTSSIAIYRSCDLIRKLQKSGFEVKVVMTENACKLVQPILFQALTNNPVYHETFDNKRIGVSHIGIAQWANLMVIAPATANIIGKISCGIADDILTTIVLAFPGPKLIAPAMNDAMWQNRIVQENCRKLKDNGFEFVGPTEGALATGKVAIGHIAPVELILLRIKSILSQRRTLAGHRFLIAGGRTEEEIDPVRVITNRASGRMALECAKAAIGRGGEVTLITGPVEVSIPDWIPTVGVRTSKKLKSELNRRIKDNDCLIMATAVSDFCTKPKRDKLKGDRLKIELERTEDIVKSLKKEGLYAIGFSLETSNHMSNGKRKLKAKGLDLIIVNTPDALGARETNAWLISKQGTKRLGIIDKEKLANIILDRYLSWSKGS